MNNFWRIMWNRRRK